MLEYLEIGATDFTEVAEGHVLVLYPDMTYSFNLSANECYGIFDISSPGTIGFKSSGCTKKCCDTPSTLKLVSPFVGMKAFMPKGKSSTCKETEKLSLKSFNLS